MKDLYTGFSNYREENLENRKNAANSEVTHWGSKSSEFTEYRQLWKKAAEESYLPDKPLHVDIEVSDACNLKCQYCAHGMGTVGKVGFIDHKLCLSLIKEAKGLGVYSLKFNWRGEATLNPRLPEYIAYAKELGILEVQINTNGLPKKKDMLIDCGKAGLDRLILSIDGFSDDTYETARVGGSYQLLLENVHAFLTWRKINNFQKPLCRVQMVRTNLNAHEVENFIRYWQPLVDDVRISDVMNRGQGEGFSVGDKETCGRRRCPQPFQRLVVGRDGRVSPCCADWDQNYLAGNVQEQSLEEIWKGPGMTQMREVQNTLKHQQIKICDHCYVKESYTWREKKIEK